MNRGEFTRAVLERLHAPIDSERLYFGVAWAAFEDTEALNNPWATTEPGFHSTDFNSVGVKNYPTFDEGVDATVQTLLLSYYSHLVSMLRDPNATVRELLGALDSSPWGSHPNTQLYQDVVLEYAKYNKQVPGSSVVSHVVPNDKENVVGKLYEKNEDGTFTEVPDETTGDVAEVPAPVEKEDTLEDRVAAQEAAEAEAAKETEESEVAQTSSTEEAVNPSTTEPSLKEKVVAEAEAFLARVKEMF